MELQRANELRTRLEFKGKRGSPLRVLGLVALVASSGSAFGQKWEGSIGGTQIFESFGAAAASGFDFDGDGLDDFVVGSPFFDRSGLVNNGIVQVFRGTDRSPLKVLTGAASGDTFGSSVALLPDLDGDGIGEVCVGAPSAQSDIGYVVLHSGKNGAILWKVDGGLTGVRLGASLCTVGDLDGDGREDVLLGAPGLDSAYVKGWNSGYLFTVSGQAGAGFGSSVAGGKDLDLDGVPDFVVGEPDFDTIFPFPVTDRGRVTAYSGATGAPLWSVVGDDAGDRLGFRVAMLRDVDGDHRAEVVAGAPFDDDIAADAGLVRVVRADGTKLYDLHGTAAGDLFGYAVQGLRDTTHDGRADLAIGALISNRPGLVRLVHGEDGSLYDVVLAPDSANASFGMTIAPGDFDGDGQTDLVIGDTSMTVQGNIGAGDVNQYSAAPASTEDYGSGWAGTSGVPLLSATLPALGHDVTLSIGNSRGASVLAFLLLGFQRISVPTSADGTLLVLPTYIIPVHVPAPGLDLIGPIDYDPALAGLELDLQALELDPGASKGLSFTPGLALTIGYGVP